MTLKVLSPDGALRDVVVFSTTVTARFFTGTINPNTADLEVSVRGAAFSSDPSLVSFSAEGWIVPNPTAFPNGLELLSGENTIEVRSIPLSGPASAPVRATVYLLDSASVQAVEPPSAITVERFDGSVQISVRGLDDSRISGYNFYASTEAGGGTLGYTKINAQLVSVPTRRETTSPLYSLSSTNLTQGADPLLLHAVLTQEDASGSVLSTDVNSSVEIPERVGEIQTEIVVSSVEQVSYFEFLHNRRGNLSSIPQTIPNGAFAVLPTTEPLYYVATSVYFDPITQIEYESHFSPEVVANPIEVRIRTQALPSVSRQQILQNAIASIHRKDEDVAVQTGSVLRDTFLDPFTSEAERIRFLLDFLYRASSFDTLLAIDDPDGTGMEIPPGSSSYKIALANALYLSNVSLVQQVIDAAFEKLAANFGKSREPGTRALGQARFYTNTTPTRTLSIPLGTIVTAGDVRFRTTRVAEIDIARLASYYNPSTRQYSVLVPVQAVNPGADGNIGPRQLSSGAPFGLSVTNDDYFFGGTGVQTNAELAAVARGALSSVDSGTTQGYYETAAKVPGVVQAQVVEASNPLMQRDYDPISGHHIGGKVDVWVQGFRLARVTDTFAFTFVRKRDVQFVVVGTPDALRFQAVDPDLTPTNPIAEMLNYPDIGLGLRNATTGITYNLDQVTILNYNTIELSQDVPQPFETPTLTDVILGDYRYRTGERFTLTRQPVENILSVVGEVSGDLDPNVYALVHPESPLGLGRSTKAGDYLQITSSSDPNVTTPSGAILTVSDEQHVIVGDYVEYVLRLGADPLTVEVTNVEGSITYQGPFTSTNPDYTIVEGTQTSPLGIRRTSGSAIADGQSVLISYRHDENFTVTYQVNLVTQALQQSLDKKKHATADVLAKGAIPVPWDLVATVVLKRGFQQNAVDEAIRVNLGLMTSGLRMGVPLRRSDVIQAIDATTGVAYLVLPLTKMARSSGSLVARDELASGQLSDTVRLERWSNPQVAVWLLTQPLTAATTTGGGPFGAFRGVFQDDVVTVLQETLPERLAEAPGRAFIIGNDGLVIPGYSDDDTLTSQGYVTSAERRARRRAITQNRVLLSIATGDAPSNHTYWATYVVGNESGERDIAPSQAEHLVPGVWTFTYSEDR